MPTAAGTDVGPARGLGRGGPASSPSPPSRPRLAEGLYRVVWRWHFYAGLLVTPVLLVVTLTGAAYIFRSEIEDAIHARLRFVEPGPSRVGASTLVDLARASRPGEVPTALELRADPRRSAVVRFDGPSPRGQSAVYVDPYNGRVLGASGEDATGAFFQAVLDLHRTLFLGTTGRIVNELTVGWTILLMVTGSYLWWPRKKEKVRGVWWPRWRGKPYVVLRDLHTVFGFYLMAPMVVILVTGLFYAAVWGWGFDRVTRNLRGKAEAAGAGPKREGPEGPAVVPRRFDGLVAAARDRYPDRDLSLTLAPAGRPVSVIASNDWNGPYGEYVMARFQLDPATAEMISHRTLAEDDHYWWHGWVYPLHVGSIYGPATKVIWMAACLVLSALPVTGIWMWWSRRPKGRTGFPRRPEAPLPRSWIALITALAVLLPVAGASIVLILAGEWTFRAVRRVSTGPLV
ncbi:PepSY-associated TM helix [Aquisphaera giovannonii]|uniref:PepSY-associated TM helix n=1 Tax=Aquisphaera giovannonii TaxID=406548 RepID=A0A5B9VVH1_9BACT|nr:PepSY domain-containing protein [Aquisphaera giovannonii]QEH32343.1 PepSY-associated TM helix [Aquisphaera giovannonii]